MWIYDSYLFPGAQSIEIKWICEKNFQEFATKLSEMGWYSLRASNMTKKSYDVIAWKYLRNS